MQHSILIVDDEALTLRTIGRALETEGYDVFSAINGEDALKIIADEKPDLALLDVVLPGINDIAESQCPVTSARKAARDRRARLKDEQNGCLAPRRLPDTTPGAEVSSSSYPIPGPRRTPDGGGAIWRQPKAQVPQRWRSPSQLRAQLRPFEGSSGVQRRLDRTPLWVALQSTNSSEMGLADTQRRERSTRSPILRNRTGGRFRRRSERCPDRGLRGRDPGMDRRRATRKVVQGQPGGPRWTIRALESVQQRLFGSPGRWWGPNCTVARRRVPKRRGRLRILLGARETKGEPEPMLRHMRPGLVQPPRDRHPATTRQENAQEPTPQLRAVDVANRHPRPEVRRDSVLHSGRSELTNRPRKSFVHRARPHAAFGAFHEC